MIQALEALGSAGHSDEMLEALAELHRVSPEKAGQGDPFRSPDLTTVERFIATGRLSDAKMSRPA